MNDIALQLQRKEFTPGVIIVQANHLENYAGLVLVLKSEDLPLSALIISYEHANKLLGENNEQQ